MEQIIFSGVVMLENPVLNNQSKVENIILELIDADMNTVVAQSKTDRNGGYNLTPPNTSEARGYRVRAKFSSSYVVAAGNGHTGIDGSFVEENNTTKLLNVEGRDYKGIDLTLAPGIEITLPQQVSVQQSVKTGVDITTTYGTIDRIDTISEKGVIIERKKDGFYITSSQSGVFEIEVYFKDMYGRPLEQRKIITVNVN